MLMLLFPFNRYTNSPVEPCGTVIIAPLGNAKGGRQWRLYYDKLLQSFLTASDSKLQLEGNYL